MHILRWPWIASAFIGLGLINSNLALSKIAICTLSVAALIDFFYIVERFRRSKSRKVTALFLCNLILNCIAAGLCLRWSNEHPLKRFDSQIVIILLVGRAFSFVGQILVAVRIRTHLIIRALAYFVGMLIVQILSIVHLNELKKLLNVYSSMYETTHTKCELPDPATETGGFIFSESPFVSTCPTRLWEQIRYNLLFASQIFVLYSITTSIWECNDDKFVVNSVAVVVECLLLSASVSMQFDKIPGSEELSFSSLVLLYIALAIYIARHMKFTERNDSNTFYAIPTNQLNGLRTQTNRHPFMFFRPPLHKVKLKL